MIRLAVFLLGLLAGPVLSAEWDYRLDPVEVAPGTYVFQGATEDFDGRNGGNIVNAAFVVTEDGVVVIDTGPSRRYGEQMRAAIARVTGKPVIRIFNTHLHPDHVFGNQAFADVGVHALEATRRGLAEEGEAFLDNLYHKVTGWMAGTVLSRPVHAVVPGPLEIGGHHFRLVGLRGHSQGDLAIFDSTTGVLVTGDLVFHQRAPTTPHAQIADWLASLDALAQLPFKVIVPGHGPAAADAAPIEQTRGYLKWLEQTLERAAEQGLDMAEVMALPLPKPFVDLALAPREFRRSVAHLYPRLEQQALARGR